MELQYFGANCVRIATKQAALVVDDNVAELGGKSPLKSGDIALYTSAHGLPASEPKIVIDQPGEYEVSYMSIKGVAARSHVDEEGKKSATIYKVTAEDITVLIVGHIYPELTDEQLEEIGLIDIMLVPVGGNGYTLDPVGALKVIKTVEPKLIIPTNYAVKGMNYPVPQLELSEAISQLGMEAKETVPKLKVKRSDLPEITSLTVLEKQ